MTHRDVYREIGRAILELDRNAPSSEYGPHVVETLGISDGSAHVHEDSVTVHGGLTGDPSYAVNLTLADIDLIRERLIEASK